MAAESAELEVRLLGGFGVVVDGRPVPAGAWRQQRAAAVVKLLALAPGHCLHREQLIEALWPDFDPVAAAANLRVALHHARRQLEAAGAPPGVFLARAGEGIALGPADAVRVDVAAFEDAAERAWRSDDPAVAEEAAAFYGGDLLPGDPYAEWASGRREPLRAAYLALLGKLAESHEARGELNRAIAARERVLGVEPADEPTHLALMRLHAMAGQPGRALAQYDRLVDRLERDVAAAPEPATRALAESVRAGRIPAAPRPSPPTLPTDRPAPLAVEGLPSGTVTFMFSDIERSTAHWERERKAMAGAVARHDALLRAAVEEYGGQVFKTVGDETCAAFAAADAALAAAVAAQRALAAEEWGRVGRLRTRMAMHVGAIEPRNDDYLGPTVNRVARLLEAAHGGQVLLTGAVAELARDHVPEGVTLRDLGEHRLRDLSRPERVFQVEAPGLATEFPALRTRDGRPSGLPVPLDALIGRERERAELSRLLTSCRLVTLTGPGGIGKTRLAVAVAQTVSNTFPDGVTFVDLAPLRDPALVAATIARALGVDEGGDRPLDEAIAVHVGDKRLLLVLDNVERILAAAPAVGELLAGCSGLVVLATSRGRLLLRGEQEYPVRPLAVPDLPVGDRRVSLETLLASPAVSLFERRARAASPDFVVIEENAAAVVAVCRRLEGLPLAIELAAARVRVLPPAQLAARLERPLGVLTGGPVDLPERQRTMRATIEWSHDLLSPEEQRLFRRLAVFTGGWTLEAAELMVDGGAPRPGIANGVEVEPHGFIEARFAVLDLVSGLVDKCLLRAVEGADGLRRFDMLATIRDYGCERLAHAGEEAEFRGRHAAWCLSLAEQAEPELTGPNQEDWFSRIEIEHDNLREALTWLIASGDGERGLRLGGSLWRYWLHRGNFGEGRHLLDGVLKSAENEAGGHRLKALHGAGVLALEQGDLRLAAAHYEELRAWSTRLDDRVFQARSLDGLGNIAVDRGDLEKAERLHQAAYLLWRQIDDPQGIAGSLSHLVEVAVKRGDEATAARLTEDVVALFRSIGDKRALSVGLIHHGISMFMKDDWARAIEYFRESLSLGRECDDVSLQAMSLFNMAEVRRRQCGYPAQARVLYEEALRISEDVGDQLGIVKAKIGLAKIAQEQGAIGDAWTHLRECLVLAQEMQADSEIAECLEALGSLAGDREAWPLSVALLAAASATREHAGALLPSWEKSYFETALARARAGYASDEPFRSAWEAARNRPFEEVMADVVRFAPIRTVRRTTGG